MEKGLHHDLTEIIIGSCFEVINELGSGFLENVYKNALIYVLKEKKLAVESEIHFDVNFRGKKVGHYVADLIVERRVVVELKCAKMLTSENQAQVINYLKATYLSTGLLVNFGNKNLDIRRLFWEH